MPESPSLFIAISAAQIARWCSRQRIANLGIVTLGGFHITAALRLAVGPRRVFN
jgi:hypothetical protein